MVRQQIKVVALSFSIKPGSGARKVHIVGDFNNWQPVQMDEQPDGSFAFVLDVGPGSYQYKFVVDGRFVVDPDNTNLAMNSFGTLNSVVEVK
ncbi:MAG: hypothetical protein HZA50_00500 [Planctomycetes bacterium]|nr:hypothetical protein [Planctomycetota bacterium]